MFFGEIKLSSATYGFYGNSFKWVYRESLSFAKCYLHYHPKQRVIIITIEGTLIFVTPTFIGIDAEWNDYYRIIERGV